MCSTVTNELLLESDVVSRLQAQCWDDQNASCVGDNKSTVELDDDVGCNTDNADQVTDVCVTDSDSLSLLNDNNVINGDAIDTVNDSD